MYLGYTPPVQNRRPGQCLQCSDSPARLSHRLPTRLSLCISLCETLVPSPPPSGSSGRPGHCQLDAQDPHDTTWAARRCSSHRLPWRALPAPLQVRGLQLACSPRSRSLPPVRRSLPEAPSVPWFRGPFGPAGLLPRSRAPPFLLEWITGSKSSLRLLLAAAASFYILR